jgi:ABC-type Fe3+-hydroxamate transport system substrate-binding protein
MYNLPNALLGLVIFVALGFSVYKVRSSRRQQSFATQGGDSSTSEKHLGEAASAPGEPPEYPLHIWTCDEPEELVHTEVELATSLEWFDSTDGDETVRVTDARGRPVTVKIEATRVEVLKV